MLEFVSTKSSQRSSTAIVSFSWESVSDSGEEWYEGCLFGLLVYGIESKGVSQGISFIKVLKDRSLRLTGAQVP